MTEKRNRSQYEQKLILGVHQILLSRGFQAVGINAVAKQAGLNKVLIYRYFGGLDGLLAAYAEKMDPFPKIVYLTEQLIKERDLSAPEQIAAAILESMIDELLGNRHFMEMLKWELSEQGPLTEAIAKSRETNGLLLSSLFARFLPEDHDVDIPAVTALLTGGIFYLFMRAGTVDVFNGIPIGTREGKERLIKAGQSIIFSLFKEK